MGNEVAVTAQGRVEREREGASSATDEGGDRARASIATKRRPRLGPLWRP